MRQLHKARRFEPSIVLQKKIVLNEIRFTRTPTHTKKRKFIHPTMIKNCTTTRMGITYRLKQSEIIENK